MGSEKLSPVKMALLRGLVASTRLTLIERKSVRALLDAYEATQRPIEPDPDAPLDVADLPAFWDARRARLGKNASVCAAELRRALEQRAGGVTGEALRTVLEGARRDLEATRWKAKRDGTAWATSREGTNHDRVLCAMDGIDRALVAVGELERQLAAAERERDSLARSFDAAATARGEMEALRDAATARATLLQSELDHARGKIEGMRSAAARAETAEGLLKRVVEGWERPQHGDDPALDDAILAARAHLQSLKGGSDAEG